jgi:hypothetical protein
MTTFSIAVIVAIAAAALAGFGLCSAFSGRCEKNHDRHRGIDRRHLQSTKFIETYDDSGRWITHDRRHHPDRRLVPS